MYETSATGTHVSYSIITLGKTVVGSCSLSKHTATVCNELAIAFDKAALKTGIRSETTGAQLLSSKQLWHMKMAIRNLLSVCDWIGSSWQLHAIMAVNCDISMKTANLLLSLQNLLPYTKIHNKQKFTLITYFESHQNLSWAEPPTAKRRMQTSRAHWCRLA